MNVTSSRSHAVLQVAVEQHEGQSQEVMLGKLSMIDLAGSERASQTDNRGVRLLEGANINRSLLALGNCINALASGCSFVPYRDSKLTRLLKDSLGGNCRTVMVANISPSHISYEDTLNTLKYANRAKNIRISARQNIVKPETHVSQYQQLIEDLRSEVQALKAKLAERGTPAAGLPMPGEVSSTSDPSRAVKAHEAGEHWKEEVVRNLESRTQLQRSLIEVERGLAQWHVEKDRACNAIARWDETSGCPSPTNRHSRWGNQPRSVEEWHDQLQQIEESIRENQETRKSISERLDQNKLAGKELQAQLPKRVLDEDLRTFLELIQRVQVLEVERLELDHLREVRRTQIEARDQEIESLREQLRLRNEHLAKQRELLSEKQRELLPRRVSLLGSTLSEPSPVQQRGPIRVMHAWAPAPPKEMEEILNWDQRPLREREPLNPSEANPIANAKDELDELLPRPALAVDWRNVEVPQASQIRGIARILPPVRGPIVPGHSRPDMAPKGWQEPPKLRPGPQTGGPQQRAGPSAAPLYDVRSRPGSDSNNETQIKPRTGGPEVNRTVASCPSPVVRGSTCPPLRVSPERRAVRRPSREDVEETNSPPQSRAPARMIADTGLGHAQAYLAPHPRRVHASDDKAGTPGKRRMRARSEHSGYRMNRVGRFVLQPR